MSELIFGGLVREVSSAPHVLKPFTVAVTGNGKERLIFNFSRHVNKQVVQNKIQFEDWRTAKQYMKINTLVLFLILSLVIIIYYEFSLLHIFSLIFQP